MANWFATAPEEQLKGKTAIIMGGGSGIGKATAEQFAAAGANIMVCGVPEQICLDTAEELRAAGGKAVGMVCDGTDANQVQAMIDKTVAEFGDIDILISTAGISLPRMNAMDATEADWDKIFAVNAKANFFLATAVARFMKEKGHGGKMVLISSQRGISAMENIALYSITKAAVMGMVRSLAVDFAPYGITVNGIAPGYVMTPMVEKGLRRQSCSERLCIWSHPKQGQDGLARGNGERYLLPLLTGNRVHHRSDAHSRWWLVHPVNVLFVQLPFGGCTFFFRFISYLSKGVVHGRYNECSSLRRSRRAMAVC